MIENVMHVAESAIFYVFGKAIEKTIDVAYDKHIGKAH